MRFLLFALLLLPLAACGSLERSHNAATARHAMLGLSKADVLACMGIPHKKAQEDNVEVWSYLSTNGSISTYGQTVRPTRSYASSYNTRDKSFCTVNVVMNAGIVTKVNYNGPRGTWLASDEQCGYAIENCVQN